MQMRRKRQQQMRGSARRRLHTSRRPGARRRLWGASIALLLPLALVLAAFVAPSGQARPASERSPEEAAQILAQRAVLHDEREAARKAKRQANLKTTVERENAVISSGCTEVSWTFRGFPDLPGNTVKLKLKINRVFTYSTYTFDGTTSTLVQPINAPPGKYKIDTRAKWDTNGAKGGFDIGIGVKCEPAPAFSIEKLQRIGASGSYTSAPLSAQVGETVGYEMIVANTGNVPLSFSSLTDPRCDAGTIAGGPGGGTLAPGASTTYTCTHLLTDADGSAGSVSNTVTLTGTPPQGEGEPVEHTSNTVVVEVTVKPPPDEPEPPPKETPPTVPGTTTPPGSSGVAASSTAQTPQSGVLALKQSAVPALKVSLPRLSGPQGCVRSSFRASVKSAGVSSVGFYMDGHKLKTMTAKSARNGKITIVIDPTKLKVGAHKLMAKITMAKTSSSSKAVRGTRKATVLRCRAAVLTPRFTG